MHPSPQFRDVVLLALLCFLCFLWRLGAPGIFDLDEGLYVAAAREMRLTGDFITPRVNGDPFFEKPPLVYWASAVSMSALGTNEFAARLPSALASTILVLLIAVFGTRFFGHATGFLAGSLFALSPLVMGGARELTLDATLDLWIGFALFCFFPARHSTGVCRSRWELTFWMACGLGMLSKGLPGFAIPALVAFVYLLGVERLPVRRVTVRLFTGRSAIGILIFLVIIIPWHVAAWHVNGQPFTDEYLIRQHLGRFKGGDTAHRAPFWFFVPAFFVGFFPWSLFTPTALFERERRGEGEKGRLEGQEASVRRQDAANNHHQASVDARAFLKIWFWIVFLLFSAAGSKLVSYILPLYAAASLLVADWLLRALDRLDSRRTLVLAGVVAVVLSVTALLAVLLLQPLAEFVEAQTHRPVRLDQVPPVMIMFARDILVIAAAASAAYLGSAWLNRRKAAIISLVAGMVAFTIVALTIGLSAIDESFQAPLHRIAQIAGSKAAEGGLVLNIGPPRRPSALFYLPDSLFPYRPGERSRVVETSGSEGLDRAIRSGARWIVTNELRASEAGKRAYARLIARDNGWALVEVAGPPHRSVNKIQKYLARTGTDDPRAASSMCKQTIPTGSGRSLPCLAGGFRP